MRLAMYCSVYSRATDCRVNLLVNVVYISAKQFCFAERTEDGAVGNAAYSDNTVQQQQQQMETQDNTDNIINNFSLFDKV